MDILGGMGAMGAMRPMGRHRDSLAPFLPLLPGDCQEHWQCPKTGGGDVLYCVSLVIRIPRPAGVNRVSKVNLVQVSGSTLSTLSTLSKIPAGRGHFFDRAMRVQDHKKVFSPMSVGRRRLFCQTGRTSRTGQTGQTGRTGQTGQSAPELRKNHTPREFP